VTRYAKAIVAILGAAITSAVSLGLLEGKAAAWAQIALSALTALAVYLVPNKPPAGEPSDPTMSEQGQTAIILVLGVVVLALGIYCVVVGNLVLGIIGIVAGLLIVGIAQSYHKPWW
jgi:hypothetical protein